MPMALDRQRFAAMLAGAIPGMAPIPTAPVGGPVPMAPIPNAPVLPPGTVVPGMEPVPNAPVLPPGGAGAATGALSDADRATLGLMPLPELGPAAGAGGPAALLGLIQNLGNGSGLSDRDREFLLRLLQGAAP